MLQRANGCVALEVEHRVARRPEHEAARRPTAIVPPPVAAAACGAHVPDVP